MKNEELLETIKNYQLDGRRHPLTCAHNSTHRLLEGIEEGGEVILKCPDCEYKQKLSALLQYVMNDYAKEKDLLDWSRKE
jgi:hypothetical protein